MATVQKEIQPLIEPLVCPKCGSQDVQEVTYNVWIIKELRWDDSLRRYKQFNEYMDEDGDRRLQCRDCSEEYPLKTLEQFDISSSDY